jgi:hypothetical protein
MALIGHFFMHTISYIFACFNNLELVNLNPVTLKLF